MEYSSTKKVRLPGISIAAFDSDSDSNSDSCDSNDEGNRYSNEDGMTNGAIGGHASSSFSGNNAAGYSADRDESYYDEEDYCGGGPSLNDRYHGSSNTHGNARSYDGFQSYNPYHTHSNVDTPSRARATSPFIAKSITTTPDDAARIEQTPLKTQTFTPSTIANAFNKQTSFNTPKRTRQTPSKSPKHNGTTTTKTTTNNKSSRKTPKKTKTSVLSPTGLRVIQTAEQLVEEARASETVSEKVEAVLETALENVAGRFRRSFGGMGAIVTGGGGGGMISSFSTCNATVEDVVGSDGHLAQSTMTAAPKKEINTRDDSKDKIQATAADGSIEVGSASAYKTPETITDTLAAGASFGVSITDANTAHNGGDECRSEASDSENSSGTEAIVNTMIPRDDKPELQHCRQQEKPHQQEADGDSSPTLQNNDKFANVVVHKYDNDEGDNNDEDDALIIGDTNEGFSSSESVDDSDISETDHELSFDNHGGDESKTVHSVGDSSQSQIIAASLKRGANGLEDSNVMIVADRVVDDATANAGEDEVVVNIVSGKVKSHQQQEAEGELSSRFQNNNTVENQALLHYDDGDEDDRGDNDDDDALIIGDTNEGFSSSESVDDSDISETENEVSFENHVAEKADYVNTSVGDSSRSQIIAAPLKRDTNGQKVTERAIEALSENILEGSVTIIETVGRKSLCGDSNRDAHTTYDVCDECRPHVSADDNNGGPEVIESAVLGDDTQKKHQQNLENAEDESLPTSQSNNESTNQVFNRYTIAEEEDDDEEDDDDALVIGDTNEGFSSSESVDDSDISETDHEVSFDNYVAEETADREGIEEECIGAGDEELLNSSVSKPQAARADSNDSESGANASAASTMPALLSVPTPGSYAVDNITEKVTNNPTLSTDKIPPIANVTRDELHKLPSRETPTLNGETRSVQNEETDDYIPSSLKNYLSQQESKLSNLLSSIDQMKSTPNRINNIILCDVDDDVIATPEFGEMNDETGGWSSVKRRLDLAEPDSTQPGYSSLPPEKLTPFAAELLDVLPQSPLPLLKPTGPAKSFTPISKQQSSLPPHKDAIPPSPKEELISSPTNVSSHAIKSDAPIESFSQSPQPLISPAHSPIDQPKPLQSQLEHSKSSEHLEKKIELKPKYLSPILLKENEAGEKENGEEEENVLATMQQFFQDAENHFLNAMASPITGLNGPRTDVDGVGTFVEDYIQPLVESAFSEEGVNLDHCEVSEKPTDDHLAAQNESDRLAASTPSSNNGNGFALVCQEDEETCQVMSDSLRGEFLEANSILATAASLFRADDNLCQEDDAENNNFFGDTVNETFETANFSLGGFANVVNDFFDAKDNFGDVYGDANSASKSSVNNSPKVEKNDECGRGKLKYACRLENVFDDTESTEQSSAVEELENASEKGLRKDNDDVSKIEVEETNITGSLNFSEITESLGTLKPPIHSVSNFKEHNDDEKNDAIAASSLETTMSTSKADVSKDNALAYPKEKLLSVINATDIYLEAEGPSLEMTTKLPFEDQGAAWTNYVNESSSGVDGCINMEVSDCAPIDNVEEDLDSPEGDTANYYVKERLSEMDLELSSVDPEFDINSESPTKDAFPQNDGVCPNSIDDSMNIDSTTAAYDASMSKSNSGTSYDEVNESLFMPNMSIDITISPLKDLLPTSEEEPFPLPKIDNKKQDDSSVDSDESYDEAFFPNRDLSIGVSKKRNVKVVAKTGNAKTSVVASHSILGACLSSTPKSSIAPHTINERTKLSTSAASRPSSLQKITPAAVGSRKFRRSVDSSKSSLRYTVPTKSEPLTSSGSVTSREKPSISRSVASCKITQKRLAKSGTKKISNRKVAPLWSPPSNMKPARKRSKNVPLANIIVNASNQSECILHESVTNPASIESNIPLVENDQVITSDSTPVTKQSAKDYGNPVCLIQSSNVIVESNSKHNRKVSRTLCSSKNYSRLAAVQGNHTFNHNSVRRETKKSTPTTCGKENNKVESKRLKSQVKVLETSASKSMRRSLISVSKSRIKSDSIRLIPSRANCPTKQFYLNNPSQRERLERLATPRATKLKPSPRPMHKVGSRTSTASKPPSFLSRQYPKTPSVKSTDEIEEELMKNIKPFKARPVLGSSTRVQSRFKTSTIEGKQNGSSATKPHSKPCAAKPPSFLARESLKAPPKKVETFGESMQHYNFRELPTVKHIDRNLLLTPQPPSFLQRDPSKPRQKVETLGESIQYYMYHLRDAPPAIPFTHESNLMTPKPPKQKKFRANPVPVQIRSPPHSTDEIELKKKFKARPLPAGTYHSTNHMNTSDDTPYYIRAGRYDMVTKEKMKRMQEEELKELKRMREVRARALPKSTYEAKPIIIEKSHIELTLPRPPRLTLDVRMSNRKLYDEHVHENRAQEDAMRLGEEQRLKEEQEEDLRRKRALHVDEGGLVFRAKQISMKLE